MLISRRALFPSAVALAARPARAIVSAAQFKTKLIGPICSVSTPYTKDFAIDHAAIKAIVECGLKAGAETFALTAGNSQYDRLTYEEIKSLTSSLIRAVNGRGMIIAATGPWWTGQAVDYARFADLAGADAVQVFLPPYGDENALFDHFLRISKVVRGAVALHGQVPFPLLARLMTIENIVAYKEEYSGIYSVEVFSKYGDRMNIFAGGQKSHYLMYRPFGMRAYYSTFSTFDPSVPKLFWSACQRDDLAAAKAVVMKYDVPFFSRFSFSYWRAVLERYGVASRFMRPPDPTFTAEQVKDLDTFFKGLGL